MAIEPPSPVKPSISDLLQDFARALQNLWNRLSNEERGSAVKQIIDLVAGLAHEDKASEGPVLDHLSEFLAERLQVDRAAARAAAATLCETQKTTSSSNVNSTLTQAEGPATQKEVLRRARELLLLVRVHYEVKEAFRSYERRVEIFFEPDERARLEDERPRTVVYRDHVDWVDLPATARAAMISEKDHPVTYDIYRRTEVIPCP